MAQLKSSNITGNLSATGNILASKIIKLGGTADQVLLANGDTVAKSELGGNSGTVTSVAMTVPTGLTVSGSPITRSGTLAITFTSGYSIPTTAKQSNWDTAYEWGNHASVGYLTEHQSLANYVTLNGDQTITGTKTFNSNIIFGTDYGISGSDGKYIANGASHWDVNGHLYAGSGITVAAGQALKFNVINAPTASNGTTYGPGTSGQVLKSNGTSVYWASDSSSTQMRQYYTLTTSNGDYPIIYSYTTATGTSSYKTTYGAVKSGFTFNPSTNTLKVGGVQVATTSDISDMVTTDVTDSLEERIDALESSGGGMTMECIYSAAGDSSFSITDWNQYKFFIIGVNGYGDFNKYVIIPRSEPFAVYYNGDGGNIDYVYVSYSGNTATFTNNGSNWGAWGFYGDQYGVK